MALVNIPITIPLDAVASAAQAVGTVGAPMTLSVSGAENDSFAIDVAGTALAFDSDDWAQLDIINLGPSGQRVLNSYNWPFANAQMSYWRIRRLVGTAAMVVNLSGAPNTQQTGPAGPPTLGSAAFSGSATLSDAGSPVAVAVASFTPGSNGAVFAEFTVSCFNETDSTVSIHLLQCAWSRLAGVLTAVGTVRDFGGSGDAMAVAFTHDVSSGVARVLVTGLATKVIRAQAYGTWGIAT